MYDFAQPVFTELVWLLGGGLLSLLAIVGVNLRIHSGKPVNPLLWGLPVGMFALTIVLAGVAGLAQPDLWTGTLAATLTRFLGGFGGLPLLGLTSLMAAVAVFRSGPVRWAQPAWVGLIALVAAVLTGVEAAQGVSILFGILRAGLFVGTAIPVVAVVAMGGERSPAAGVVTLGWATAVCLLEASNRALVQTLALRAAADIPDVGLRGTGVERMVGIVAGELPWAWAVVGVASLAPLGVILLVAKRARRATDLVALTWLLLLPLVFAWGLPDVGQLTAAAEQGPPGGG